MVKLQSNTKIRHARIHTHTAHKGGTIRQLSAHRDQETGVRCCALKGNDPEMDDVPLQILK